MEQTLRRFENKGAIITGGVSGIGAATVTRLIDEGAHVVVVDISDNGSQFTHQFGERATFIKCDVSSHEAVTSTIEKGAAWLQTKGKKIDVLFNNAGISSAIGETPDISIEDWQRVMDINLNSIFYSCRVVIPLMREGGGGTIINTASISGLAADYAFNAYNASKGAVVNYTRTLALDHAKDNIQVNAVCPGIIKTSMTEPVLDVDEVITAWSSAIPAGRPGEASEVAAAVSFLASDDARYITGAILTIDGGLTARTGQPNVPQLFESLNTDS